MIHKYFNFRLFSLLESILVINPDFFNILEIISNKGDFVAQSILNLVGNDVKTNVNYLKPSDKNDDLKFINDTQVKRHIDAGKKDSDIFSMSSNTAKIGRTVRQILTSNGVSVTDSQIENFVNLYKNSWDKKYSKFEEGFYLIKGEAIRDWYLEDNYVSGSGALNKSCMRYDNMQPFLNIYTENPEVCQLLILVDDNNLLLGRALLWKLVEGAGKSPYYLDRIYTRYDSDVEKFEDWFKDFIKKDEDFSAHFENSSGCMVKLKKWIFEFYPYMDTFSFLGFESGILKTRRNYKEIEYYLQHTTGQYSVPDHFFSRYYNVWINASNVKYFKGDYYYLDDVVRDYIDNDILKKDSVYSKFYDKYVDKEYAVELKGYGLVDKSDIIIVYDSISVDGTPENPKKYLESINSEYRWINNINEWINKELAIYSISEEHWILDAEIDSNKIYIYDIDDMHSSIVKRLNLNSEIYNDIYYKKYNFTNDIVSYIPFIQSFYIPDIGHSWFMSEASLKCVDGIDIDSLYKCVININDYFKNFKLIINSDFDKQLSDVKNKEMKLEELKKSINFIENESVFKKNNNLYNLFKKYGDDFFKILNINLAQDFKSKDILSKLYFVPNIIELNKHLKYRKNLYIKPDSKESDQKQLQDFIKDYEYYILLYVYIYTINGGLRSVASDVIDRILYEDDKNPNLGSIFNLFTYNDTFPTFSKTINLSYRGEFENSLRKIASQDYKKSFDIFYKELKKQDEHEKL